MPLEDGWEPISPDDGWEPMTPDQYPGMPSPSMRNQAKPWQMPQVGNVDQLAQFQQEQAANEPTPPMARDFSLGQQDAPDPRSISELSPDEAQTRMERVLRPSAGGAPQRTPYIAPDSPFGQAAGHLAGAAGVVMPIQAAGGVVPALLDAAYGTVGAGAFGAAGDFIGGGLEKAGLPKGTKQVLATGGGIAGGLLGGFGGPAVLRSAAESGLLHGPWAAAARWLGGSAKKKAIDTAERMAAKTAAKTTAFEVKQRAAAEAQTIADQLKVEEQFRRSVEAARKAEAAKRGMAEAADARSGIKVENQWANANPVVASSTASNLEQDLINAGVAPRVAKEMAAAKSNVLQGDFINPKYVSVVPEEMPLAVGQGSVAPAGQRAMATNLGGSARPGPAPAAPQDLEAALRQTLEEARITKALPKAGKTAGPVPSNYEVTAEEMARTRAARLADGAVKGGRKLGKTRTQTTLDADTVAEEGLGGVSPFVPQNPKAIISAKLRGMTRDEAEKYINLTKSAKNRAQYWEWYDEIHGGL